MALILVATNVERRKMTRKLVLEHAEFKLAAAGIRVVAGKIAAADVERATKILTEDEMLKERGVGEKRYLKEIREVFNRVARKVGLPLQFSGRPGTQFLEYKGIHADIPHYGILVDNSGGLNVLFRDGPNLVDSIRWHNDSVGGWDYSGEGYEESVMQDGKIIERKRKVQSIDEIKLAKMLALFLSRVES